jgi:hypothetical protein
MFEKGDSESHYTADQRTNESSSGASGHLPPPQLTKSRLIFDPYET